MILSKSIFYKLANCYTPKFGSASNILSFALWMSENISESMFNVPVSPPLGHFHPFYNKYFFSIYVDTFSPVMLLWLYIRSPSVSARVRIPTFSYFFFNSLYVWFRFYFQYFHSLILCFPPSFPSYLPLPIPSLDCLSS